VTAPTPGTPATTGPNARDKILRALWRREITAGQAAEKFEAWVAAREAAAYARGRAERDDENERLRAEVALLRDAFRANEEMGAEIVRLRAELAAARAGLAEGWAEVERLIPAVQHADEMAERWAVAKATIRNLRAEVAAAEQRGADAERARLVQAVKGYHDYAPVPLDDTVAVPVGDVIRYLREHRADREGDPR
jgi:hypothetical protein